MQKLQSGNHAPAPAPAPAPKEEPLLPEGTDLNDMDNSQLFQLMIKAVDHQLNKAGELVQQRLEGINNQLTTTGLQTRVKEVAKENPDFMAYREVMGSLAQRYPSLDPLDLYNLAKSKAPEIGQRLAAEKEEQEKAARSTNVLSFGGLTPTSGSSATDTEDMDFKDASAKAWDEIMKDIPGEIIGGGNN
jgi:hypothetical protein